MTKVQIGICIAVARHFNTTKAAIKAVAEEYFKELGSNHPVLALDLSQQLGVSLKIMCSKNTIGLKHMFFMPQLKKQALYADILNAFVNSPAEVLAFYSGNALIAVHEAQSYNGVGGILVKGGGESYVCEPMAHYLEGRYPKANYNEYDS